MSVLTQQEAIRLLKALSLGIDPRTGQVLPEESPYQAIEINRALQMAIDALRDSATIPERSIRKQSKAAARKKTLEEKRAANIAAGKPECTGEPWTDDDSGRLSRRYQAGEEIESLAGDFRRSSLAIATQLRRILGHLRASDEECYKLSPASAQGKSPEAR